MTASRWFRPAAFTVCALAALAPHTLSAQKIRVGPNVRVSTGRPDEAHYEVNAAAHPKDPNKLIATGIIYPEGKRRGSIVYMSNDGGKTWSPSFQGDVLTDTGDPVVAWGPDGTAYFSVLTGNGHPLQVKPEKPAHAWDGRHTLLYRLPAGKTEWEGPAIFRFADRQYIAFDDTKGKYNGRVYVSGDPRPKSGYVVFTSTDGAKTFSDPGAEADNLGNGNSIGSIGVASDGTVFGAYAAQGHVLAVTSTDGGATLTPTVVVDTFVRAGGRKEAGKNNVNHFMTLAVDRSGGKNNDRFYVAWPDRRSGHSKVYFTYSSDKGKTWAPTRVITDNAASDTTDQFMPTLAVNKDGVVGLLWYDRRDNPDNLSYYARFMASKDGGVTWLPSVRVSAEPYVSGPVSKKSAFPGNGGDTAGLATTSDGAFHPVWIDDRTGVPQMWTATVTVQK